MKKSHKAYLCRLIGKAIAEVNRDDLTDEVLNIKSPDTGVYRLIRDIVCDSRFYSVTDGDTFWKRYGTYRIGHFLDSLSPAEIDEEETLTMRKEEFLNDWMVSHMMPVSRERRDELQAEIKLMAISDDGGGIPDPNEHDGSSLGVIHLGNGIKDSTERSGLPADGLPKLLRDYMDDSALGNSPGLHNEGHKADARFLDRIDPSILKLAEIIGQRGGETIATEGKFSRASKSDISGVAVGDDLGSLLPSELALLASPECEKVFLDRFARKKLQIFSSASKSISDRLEKVGPVYVCIDTSGSMTGMPEDMAKTLALAISIIAQRKKRPVCIFNYSDNLSFFVLSDIRRQRSKLLRFLSDSYGGSNDENKLIDFLLGRMPKMERYRSVVAAMKCADMLVISDFLWIGVEPEKKELLLKARRKGMRIFSVGIGIDPHILGRGDEEEDEKYYRSRHLSGFQFFRKSDFRYQYEDGIIKEMNR